MLDANNFSTVLPDFIFLNRKAWDVLAMTSFPVSNRLSRASILRLPIILSVGLPCSPLKGLYEQVKRRETKITFELGELRVKENRLMDELNKLSLMLGSK
ncbi:MAG: hypothetical protein ACI9J4_001334 [Paraglaciecola sp.]|jgi:hypothetical protein